MFVYTLKKFAYHMAVCAVIWLLIDRLSPQGRLYAGWFAGFLGAAYFLAAWLSFLKKQGYELFTAAAQETAAGGALLSARFG